jgi:hypothetical protein
MHGNPLYLLPWVFACVDYSIIHGLSGCIRVRFVRTQEPIQVHTCTSYTYVYKKETNVPLYGLGGLILQLPHRIIRPLLLPPTTPLRHLLRTHRLTGRPANIRTFSLLSYVDIGDRWVRKVILCVSPRPPARPHAPLSCAPSPLCPPAPAAR